MVGFEAAEREEVFLVIRPYGTTAHMELIFEYMFTVVELTFFTKSSNIPRYVAGVLPVIWVLCFSSGVNLN